MDLGRLAGYPKQDDRELTDDPQAWLSEPVLSHYDVKWWESAFIRTFFDAVKKHPARILTLNEFTVKRWMWVTSGASSASRAMLDGKLVRTKFGAAVSLSDEELLRHVAAVAQPKDQDHMGIFIKPDEMGYKRRLIANVPLGGYIVAAYIRYLLEEYLGRHPAFMKFDLTYHDNLDVITLLREGRLCMPLDESAYDYHVSRESWQGFFSFLKFLFPANSGVTLFEKYFEKAYWLHDGQRGRWISGMPSGLALTSFLNSWMNFIKQSHLFDSPLHWAAGDDALLFPGDGIALETVEQAYSRFGSRVNASKNWVSHRYGEYLKGFYSAGGVSGYPARIWATLMWASMDRMFLPADKLAELAELWKQFFDRLGLPMDLNYVAEDLSRSVSKKTSGFSKRVAIQWLHASKVRGGFGRLPYNDLAFSWDAEVERSLEYENVRIRVPRFLKYRNRHVRLVVRREVRKPTPLFRTGPPLRLPPVENLSQWEARLNGEDNPIGGPFRSMALDVIPLPVVDFVSTSKMSSMASGWGYNVYPNIRGSWEKITSRLEEASLHLAEKVLHQLREAGITAYV